MAGRCGGLKILRVTSGLLRAQKQRCGLSYSRNSVAHKCQRIGGDDFFSMIYVLFHYEPYNFCQNYICAVVNIISGA